MSSFRSAILIIGLLVFFVASALLTVLILYAAGVILTDPVELVYSVDNVEKVYDGQPLTAEEYRLESGNILEGHTAQVEIKGSQTDAGTSESTLEVKFFDKNGFDVSREYSVKVIAGTLTVYPQDITVSINDTQVVYNGQEVDFENYELVEGTLAAGHRISASSKTTLLNCGVVPAEALTPVVFNAQGAPVTENYNVTLNIGKTEIVPRPITIRPENVTVTYDGTDVTADKYEITKGSLAVGQTAQVTVVKTSGGAATARSVSENHIAIGSIKIFSEDGVTEVTDNYDIEYDSAYLTILKRDITVSTASASFVYDGNEHYETAISVISGSLVVNQVLEVSDYSVLTDVDRIDNELTYAIRGEDGVVTANYNVTEVLGTLEVTKRPVTIALNDIDAGEYTGSEITLDANKAFDGNSEFYIWGFEVTEFKLTPLGDTVNAGTYSYTARYLIENGNFTVSFDYGRYEIKRKSVTLSVANKTRTVTYGNIYNFVAGEELTCGNYTVSEAGYTVKNNLESAQQIFSITSAKISNDNEDITNNLIINFENAQVYVSLLKRGLSFTYIPYTYEDNIDYMVLQGLVNLSGATPLADGDRLDYIEVSASTSFYMVDFDYCKILNSEGKDVTKYYYLIDEDVYGQITQK